jgi:sugar phosphate isomerase/epimerase
MRFGISTHLYHEQKLDRSHLAQVAAHGFESIELFATRSHFDYRDQQAVAALAQWLDATGLRLHSVHAPITDRFGAGDKWLPTYSIAAADARKRQASVDEVAAALAIAKVIPFQVLVLHVGTPDSRAAAGDNNSAAAARSVEEICRVADPLGVRVALEVIPNALSTPAALVTVLERDPEPSAGICLDFGHAFLGGDLLDAIEIVGEHVIATHVHDNHRRNDDHLAPYLGAIDWDAALTSMLKIGFEGTYMMELASIGTPEAVLERARQAREQFERALTY